MRLIFNREMAQGLINSQPKEMKVVELQPLQKEVVKEEAKE